MATRRPLSVFTVKAMGTAVVASAATKNFVQSRAAIAARADCGPPNGMIWYVAELRRLAARGQGLQVKALRNEPEARYHSPAELAADLGRGPR